MIDWVRVALIIAGAFVGGELGQRFAVEQGRIILFQPRWSSRVLNLLTDFGVVTFLEANQHRTFCSVDAISAKRAKPHTFNAVNAAITKQRPLLANEHWVDFDPGRYISSEVLG